MASPQPSPTSSAGRLHWRTDAETPRASHPRLDGISFLHRFGSALNHHVHLHACVTDGVFEPAAAATAGDAPPAFLSVRPITPADLAALTERVRCRVIRWFRLARLLVATAAADMLAWENSDCPRQRGAMLDAWIGDGRSAEKSFVVAGDEPTAAAAPRRGPRRHELQRSPATTEVGTALERTPDPR
jgi:hypothetical protein